MKYNFLFSTLIFCFVFQYLSGQTNPKYGKALLVFVETNPKLVVAGSDEPRVVIYENGQVIYNISQKEDEFYEVDLGKNGVKQLLATLPLSKIAEMNEYTKASNDNGQPENIVLIDYGSIRSSVTVYGNLTDSLTRKKTRSSFLSLYDKLKAYRSPDAVAWHPSMVELMFWGYPDAVMQKDWLQDFPTLESPATIQQNENFYSMFIPWEKFNTFLRYFESLDIREAVIISGKKMTCSYRFPFPSLW